MASPATLATHEVVSGAQTESSVVLLTRHKLPGQNYIPWARSMMMFVSSKGTEDYLTG